MILLAVDNAPSFTPSELATFLGCAVFVLGAIVLARKVWGNDPPLHKQFATQEQHADLKKEIEKLDKERRTSVANLHDKIEGQSTRLARVEEKTDGQTRQLHQIQNTVEAMPEKIVRLLKS